MKETQAGMTRPSIASSAAALVGIVPFIGGLMLIYQLIGIQAPYFGFLFLLYWMSMLHQQAAQYFPSLIGGLGGIGLAWFLLTIPAMHGTAGLALGLALLASVLLLFIRQQARLIVNNATMLFLTVATIPQIDVTNNALDFVASLLFGALYCGALVMLMKWMGNRRKLPASPEPTA